jgi:hypothetical protein
MIVSCGHLSLHSTLSIIGKRCKFPDLNMQKILSQNAGIIFLPSAGDSAVAYMFFFVYYDW